MNAEATKTAKQSAGELLKSAKEGGFRVTEDIANELITTLRNCIDQINNTADTFRNFDNRPPLGGHNYGRMVAEHMYQAANGPNSARVVIEQFKIFLEMSIEALQHASGQYRETEENIVDSIRDISH